MQTARPTPGRRERNKREKLDRIMAAASELFAQHGVDEVTTQQIADRADIGSGTLFLYARTKGELLLLVQNAAYADALARGEADADAITDTLDAVLAIVRPVVQCNRTQIDNGRTYLREMVFGDADEPYHREALAIVTRTENAVASVLRRTDPAREAEAAIRAQVVSAIVYLSLVTATNIAANVEDIVRDIRNQVRVLLSRDG